MKINKTTCLKIYAVLITLVALALVGLCLVLFVDSRLTRFRIGHAKATISINNDCEKEALKSSPEEAANTLNYILSNYPSCKGGVQIQNSFLDSVVEKERKKNVKSIINYLKKKTGEDLGPDPKPWIEKYKTQ